MSQTSNPRSRLATMLVTGVVVLALTLIVLGAALSPPGPEKVVSDMLSGLARQHFPSLEKTVLPSVLADLQQSAAEEPSWQEFWENGPLLFKEYRIGETVVTEKQAVVTVYYGAGAIREVDFSLSREGRGWKVRGIIH